MPTVTGEIVIDRPPEVVFDYVADQRNEVRYNPEMVRSRKVTDGEIGLGTRFEATVRSRGHPMDMVIEVTGFDRPRLFASHTTMSSTDIVGALTFTPDAGRTRMAWRWQLRPRGALRLLSPVMAAIGRRQELRIWTALKHVLESDPTMPA